MGLDCASERVPIALAEADQRTPGRRHQRRLPMSILSAPRRRASALKRNCDVARCAVPRHLKLRAMVGRGGIHGSS